ncbi:transporter substrate-binding domain-containing protein [Pikeienuella sp. HZG-20]|uniref:transporter substrate-binding domain-containing protein n=1 Tax=Paludibacillus litoralis TaxID=3133267 RepID=UPI0030EF09C3
MSFWRHSAIGLALAAGVTGLLGAGAAEAQDSSAKSLLFEIQDRGVLRVGMTGDYYPMTYREPGEEEFVGHQVDAARELAKDLGVKVEFVTTEWKTIITGIQASKYDVAMPASMSLARAKVVGLTDSWGMNGFVPVVLKKNVDKYQSWDDLDQADQTAGVTLGTTMEDYIRAALPNAQMRRVEAPGTGWQEVLAGRSDYTVTTLVEASGLQERYSELKMIFPNQVRSALPMTFLAPIGDPIWINYLNTWIYLKKTSGYFDALNEKWGVVLLE